jgi:hypothetical protein
MSNPYTSAHLPFSGTRRHHVPGRVPDVYRAMRATVPDPSSWSIHDPRHP